MKTFMLLLLFSTISLSLAQPSPDPVRDVDGQLLRAGTKYYILPAFRGTGGGLALGSTRNESCPLDVVQAKLKYHNGLPLTFTPKDSKKGVIREQTDLNVVFSASSTSTCIQSNVWNLRLYDKRYIVAANGVSGNPGPATLGNWFMIHKFEDAYKLVFCPKVCKVCRPPCGDIGIKIAKNGRRSLGLSSEPLKVMFKKA